MILANEVERGLWRAVLLAALARDSDDAVGDADRATLAYRERTTEAHGYVEARPSDGASTHILRGWAGTVAGLDSDVMAKMTAEQILGAVADMIPVDACADMAEHADEIEDDRERLANWAVEKIRGLPIGSIVGRSEHYSSEMVLRFELDGGEQ